MDFRLFIRKNIFQNVLVIRKNYLPYEHPEVHSDNNVIAHLFLFNIGKFFSGYEATFLTVCFFPHVPPTERSLFLLQNFEQSDFSDNSYHLFPFVSQKYRVTTFQLDSHFNLYIVNVFPSQKLKINFCRNICGSVCDHVCVVASKKF